MIKTQKKFSNEPPVDSKSSDSSAVRAVVVNICYFPISLAPLCGRYLILCFIVYTVAILP